MLFFHDIFGVFGDLTSREASNLADFTLAVSMFAYIMFAIFAAISIADSGDYEWFDWP